MNAKEVLEISRKYIIKQIDSIAEDKPAISFIRPVIIKAIDNNMYKARKALSLISDEYGNIDMATLLPEMIESVMTTKPFIQQVPILGDVEIGGGSIKLSIPLTNKRIVLGKADLDVIKDLFTENND
jgi:hypothetical protein